MEILILVFACVNLIILEQKRANLVSVSVLSRMLELLWLAARWKPETSFALVPNTSLLPHQIVISCQHSVLLSSRDFHIWFMNYTRS